MPLCTEKSIVFALLLALLLGCTGNAPDEAGTSGQQVAPAPFVPLATPPGAVVVFDSTDKYVGECGHTGTASFAIPEEINATIVQAWHDFGEGENEIPLTMYFEGAQIAGGTALRADCAPSVAQWCNANFNLNTVLAKGNYSVELGGGKMCLKPGHTGMVRIYGEKFARNSAVRLSNCSFSGIWDSDWGMMELNQTNGYLEGKYAFGAGNIAGEIRNGEFTGAWSEFPSSGQNASGGILFYFPQNCDSFRGDWQYGPHFPGQAWSGVLVANKID